MNKICEKKKIQVFDLLGTKIYALTMNEVLDICQEHIDTKNQLLLGVVNVAKVVNSRRDPQLRNSLDEADIVLADGQPLIWLSRILRIPLPERVAGIDLMYRLLETASKKNYSVFFLGAKPEVINRVVEIVKVQYPGVGIAGYRDGYFDILQEAEIAQKIKSSSADIIFVALSSPKKEIFLKKWRKYMNIPVCHGVGGSFDVMAGLTKRAPVWMQKSGLEWLYRLIQEPRRMWKRYLVTNVIFLFLSIKLILCTWCTKTVNK